MSVYDFNSPENSNPIPIDAHAAEFKLISALKFSNIQIVQLIYFVFNGFPSHCQLLRCSKATHPEEIELFFQRISFFHTARYLILGINELTNELQQVMYQICVTNVDLIVLDIAVN